jgi:hypothetical protein
VGLYDAASGARAPLAGAADGRLDLGRPLIVP